MNRTATYGGYNFIPFEQISQKEKIDSQEQITSFIVERIDTTSKILSGLLDKFTHIDYERLNSKSTLDKIIDKLSESHKNTIQISKIEYIHLLNKTSEDILISFAYRKYYENSNNLDRKIKFSSILDEDFFILELLENLGIRITVLMQLEKDYYKFLVEKLTINPIKGEWGKIFTDNNEIFFLIYKNNMVYKQDNREVIISDTDFANLF